MSYAVKEIFFTLQGVSGRNGEPFQRGPIITEDAIIAATADLRALVVLTDNVRDFDPTGVAHFNPQAPDGVPAPSRYGVRGDHRYRKRGRIPLRLARMAEPLLIIAVITGLIKPPGRARARAAVFRAATRA